MKKFLTLLLIFTIVPAHLAFAVLDAKRVPKPAPLFPIPEEIQPSFSGNVNSGPDNQVNEAERGLLKQAGQDVPEVSSPAEPQSASQAVAVTPAKKFAYWVFVVLAIILIILSYVMVRHFRNEDKKS